MLPAPRKDYAGARHPSNRSRMAPATRGQPRVSHGPRTRRTRPDRRGIREGVGPNLR